MQVMVYHDGSSFAWEENPGRFDLHHNGVVMEIASYEIREWRLIRGKYDEMQGQVGRLLENELQNRELAATPCPQCEAVGTLSMQWKLVARPLGSHSLAGAQVKLSARETPYIECSECRFSKAGEPTTCTGMTPETVAPNTK